MKRRFSQSSGFQSIRHASRTIKGIGTIQAIYKQRRSLSSELRLFDIQRTTDIIQVSLNYKSIWYTGLSMFSQTLQQNLIF